MQRVEIRSVKGNQSRTEILIDGHKIDGVRSYEIKQIAGCYPILSIDIKEDNFGEVNDAVVGLATNWVD